MKWREFVNEAYELRASVTPSSFPRFKDGATEAHLQHAERGRVAIVAGGGAQTDMLAASIEKGCQTYVTGNASSACPLAAVRREIDEFAALAARNEISVIDATHYGSEKLPQLEMLKWFTAAGVKARFAPGVPERRDGRHV